jgi:hypothetical protein
MLWLIDFDHNLTLAFRYANFYTPGIYDWVSYLDSSTVWPGQTLKAGHGKKKRSPKMIQGSEGLNNYVINYLQPWADVFFGGLVESVGQMGKTGGKKTTIAEAQWGNAVLPK